MTRAFGRPSRVDVPDKESTQQRIAELSALSTHLLDTTERDRSELAKKLHDELGGLITAAKMDMQWLSAHIGASLDAPATEKFNSVVQMLNQAMMLKRRVVENLRPSLLDHFGLGVALRSHFEEQCKSAGVECVASVPEDSLALNSSAQLTLFRVAEDVLAGILTRGDSRNVEMVIEPEEGGYSMVIGDDGAAMDPDLSRTLPSVRHRLESVGGRIEVEVRDGAGAGPSGNQVRVYVPISAAGSA